MSSSKGPPSCRLSAAAAAAGDSARRRNPRKGAGGGGEAAAVKPRKPLPRRSVPEHSKASGLPPPAPRQRIARPCRAAAPPAGDELVKHMSNVPPYLLRPEKEGGGSTQGKALSFGVLEWGHLERYMHQRQPARPASSFAMAQAQAHTPRSHVPSCSSSSRTHLDSAKPRKELFPARPSSSRSESAAAAIRAKPHLRSNAAPGEAKIHGGVDAEVSDQPRVELKEESHGNASGDHVFEGIRTVSQRPRIPYSCPLPQPPKEAHGNAAIAAGTDKGLSGEDAFSGLRDEEPAAPAGKGRRSPLRRMLDPLLKPISRMHSYAVAESPRLKKLPMVVAGAALLHARRISVDKAAAAADPPPDAAAGLKLHRDPSPVKHAVLKVAWKNGHPLFILSTTESDVLAAAPRAKNPSSDKPDTETVYSILTVQEHKRKTSSMWMKPGGGGSSSGELESNVIAEMQVSCRKAISARQFVLLEATSDMQFKNELAAFVQEGAGTTAVLPGGIHGMSSSGGAPTPLLERWKSGGACDCGGWDEGCVLSILASADHTDDHRIELFAQGQAQEGRRSAAFSMVAVKEGVYRVEFAAASLALLQAFAACVAVLHEAAFAGGGEKRGGTTAAAAVSQSGTPRSLAPSYRPPLSPVGRA